MSCLVSRHGSGRRRPEGRTGPYSTGHPIPAAVADRIRDRHLPSRPNRISAAQPRGSPAHTSYSILSARRVPDRTRTVQRGLHREMPDVREPRWTNRLPYSTAYTDVFTRLRSTVRLAARQSAIPDRAWRISSRRGTRERDRRAAGCACGTPDGISVQPYCVLEPGMQSTNGSTNGYAGQSVHQLARVHPTAVKRIEWHSAT